MAEDANERGGLRTPAEQVEGKLNQECFDRNPATWESKLENFPKYVRRQNLTRFLALYEIFKQVVDVKGSLIECGVYEGFGLMTWAKLSAILEPVNLMRRIYGFDSFEGFPSLSRQDRSKASGHTREGDFYADSYGELQELVKIYDSSRYLGHMPKAMLIKGDACKTIPLFVEENPHLVVSLLYLDFDLYEPTKVALQHFLPRMPRGAIIAFDELDTPKWPGETQAMLEFLNESGRRLKIQRLPFDPYIGYAVLD